MFTKNKIRIKVPFKQTVKILLPYISSKIKFQIKAVSIIVLYLVFFQIFILGIPVQQTFIIAGGIALVVFGLAFFMEGLIIGIMPLGEYCGKQLPRKLHLVFILFFAFVIGFAATLAEPAISVLNAAGSSVKPWESPLLFALLNGYSLYLILSICIGVGLAVLIGVLRFVYKWSLKPFIYILFPSLILLSLYLLFNKKLLPITGLAWDSGGITTGPVTVPLIIALGIGISRVISGSDENASGLGVVTLASVFPIITVILTAMALAGFVPNPAGFDDFFLNNKQAEKIFATKELYTGSFLSHCSNDVREEIATRENINQKELLENFIANPLEIISYFKNHADFENWVLQDATLYQLYSDNKDKLSGEKISRNTFIKNGLLAVRAILPLSLLLILLLTFLPGGSLPRRDEIALGVILSIIGMTLFNIGIEKGLSNLGNQVGITLPATFKTIDIPGEKKIIKDFDESLVIRSTTASGEKKAFFYLEEKSGYKQIPYNKTSFNEDKKEFIYTAQTGPVAGKNNTMAGFLLLIIFAFFMGYSVTLAEPALNALGITLEEITVGTFTRKLLIQSVAIGVGIGMGFGIVRIIFDIPLILLLIPPYIVLLGLTFISEERFVTIAWDSAGVTTGPVTVPLVISMGLGVGQQTGVSDGFGILALSSAYPILTVLIVGLFVQHRQNVLLKESYITSGTDNLTGEKKDA